MPPAHAIPVYWTRTPGKAPPDFHVSVADALYLRRRGQAYPIHRGRALRLLAAAAELEPPPTRVVIRGPSCRIGERLMLAHSTGNRYARAAVESWAPNHAGLAPRATLAPDPPRSAKLCRNPLGPAARDFPEDGDPMETPFDLFGPGTPGHRPGLGGHGPPPEGPETPEAEEERREHKVRVFAEHGCSDQEIAESLDISPAELQRAYQPHLCKGRLLRRIKLRSLMYSAAMKGNAPCLRFLYQQELLSSGAGPPAPNRKNEPRDAPAP